MRRCCEGDLDLFRLLKASGGSYRGCPGAAVARGARLPLSQEGPQPVSPCHTGLNWPPTATLEGSASRVTCPLETNRWVGCLIHLRLRRCLVTFPSRPPPTTTWATVGWGEAAVKESRCSGGGEGVGRVGPGLPLF